MIFNQSISLLKAKGPNGHWHRIKYINSHIVGLASCWVRSRHWHGAFTAGNRYLEQYLVSKKFNANNLKISYNNSKMRIMKHFNRNLTKLAQQAELQLAVIGLLTLREHTKTLWPVFRLARRSTSGCSNFAGHSGLRTCWIMRFARKQPFHMCVSNISSTGHMTQLCSLWCLQTIFYLFF